MLGDPARVDPLSVAVDRFATATAARIADGARRVRRWLREQDPAARLGMDIIAGAQRQMLESRAHEALAMIPSVRCGHWWLAPALACPGAGGRLDLVAAEGRIAAIETRARWGAERSPAVGLRGRLDRLAIGDMDVVPVVAVAEDPVRTRWAATADGEVLVTSVDLLAEVVELQLDGSGRYDPDANHELSRLLHGALVAERQRSTALAVLAQGLDLRSWVIAPGAAAAGSGTPIDLLAIGPAGIFVCEAAGLEPLGAAQRAVSGARAVAHEGRGLEAEVVPVVLCDPGSSAGHLALRDGHRAWALPIDQAPARLRTADREGLRAGRIRRIRRPAPGWRYGIADTDDGLVYEVAYDLSRHDRPPARR